MILKNRNRFVSYLTNAITAAQKNPALAFALALGLFWLVFIYTSGIQLSPDSGYYTGYAFNMHYGGDYFVHPQRPPVYPLLIHLFMFFDGFPAGAAALISGFSMVVILVVFALILQRFNNGNDTILNCLMVLALFFFSHFLLIFQSAWSEAPFALFSILNVYFIIRHLDTGKTKYYVFASLCVSLTILTRFMGYALLIVFFMYTIYYLYKQARVRKVILKYLLINSISYLPQLAFITRNYLFNKTFHGSRAPSQMTVFSNYRKVLQVLSENLNIYFIILLVVSLVIAIFILQNRIPLKKRHNIKPKSYIFVYTFIYIFSYVFLYTGILIYTTSRVRVDPVSDRYFSPLYPLLFLFVYIVLRIMKQTPLFTGDKTVGHKHARLNVFLLELMVYGLMIAMIIVHINDSTLFLKFIRKNQYDTQCYQLKGGFALSPVVGAMNQYLKSQLSERDTIYIAAIHEVPSHKNYPHLAQTTFFRRGIIDGESATEISFEKVDNHGFTICFNLKGKKKSLVYRNLPYMKVGKRFFSQLEKEMVAEKISSLYLVTGSNLRQKSVWCHEISNYLSEKLRIISRDQIGLYLIYRLEYNP